MSRTLVVLVTALLLVGYCLAAAPVAPAPVAAVSSNQSIIVSGITVPTNRVISWPVSVNDEITTQAAPAMVRFNDGTVVTIQRNSRAKLTAGQAGVEVKMLSGSAIYDIKPRSTVSIRNDVTPSATVANGRSVTPATVPFPVRGSASSNAAVASALAQAPPSSGVVLAAADTKSGVFSSAPRARTLPTQGSDFITLSNGTRVEVHLVSGGGGNAPSVYVIDRIVVAIPDTSRPGETLYLAPPKGFVSPLIGASLTIPSGLNPTVGINLNVTLLNGTPLTPAQLADLLQQATNAAYNDPANFLPSGTTAPQFPNPVTNGVLSGHST